MSWIQWRFRHEALSAYRTLDIDGDQVMVEQLKKTIVDSPEFGGVGELDWDTVLELVEIFDAGTLAKLEDHQFIDKCAHVVVRRVPRSSSRGRAHGTAAQVNPLDVLIDEFRVDAPDALTCPVCRLLFHKASKFSCCGKIVCAQCGHSAIDSAGVCPFCRHTNPHLLPDRHTDKLAQDIYDDRHREKLLSERQHRISQAKIYSFEEGELVGLPQSFYVQIPPRPSQKRTAATSDEQHRPLSQMGRQKRARTRAMRPQQPPPHHQPSHFLQPPYPPSLPPQQYPIPFSHSRQQTFSQSPHVQSHGPSSRRPPAPMRTGGYVGQPRGDPYHPYPPSVSSVPPYSQISTQQRGGAERNRSRKRPRNRKQSRGSNKGRPRVKITFRGR